MDEPAVTEDKGSRTGKGWAELGSFKEGPTRTELHEPPSKTHRAVPHCLLSGMHAYSQKQEQDKIHTVP